MGRVQDSSARRSPVVAAAILVLCSGGCGAVRGEAQSARETTVTPPAQPTAVIRLQDITVAGIRFSPALMEYPDGIVLAFGTVRSGSRRGAPPRRGPLTVTVLLKTGETVSLDPKSPEIARSVWEIGGTLEKRGGFRCPLPQHLRAQDVEAIVVAVGEASARAIPR